MRRCLPELRGQFAELIQRQTFFAESDAVFEVNGLVQPSVVQFHFQVLHPIVNKLGSAKTFVERFKGIETASFIV